MIQMVGFRGRLKQISVVSDEANLVLAQRISLVVCTIWFPTVSIFNNSVYWKSSFVKLSHIYQRTLGRNERN